MMRRPRLRQGGFSIAEAVIAAMVFIIAVTGVLATIGNIKKPSVRTDRSLTAAYVGQKVLEDMRNEVDAGTWDTGPLKVGPNPRPCPNAVANCTYSVDEDPVSHAREVTVNVTWPDNL
jgi:type II secretory pathway pseudopilin PulG